MGTLTRNWLMAAMFGLLVACGGGGGGDRAAGVEPGPPPGNGPVDPPPPIVPEPTPPPAPYAEATVLLATITNLSLDGDNRATVQFQLTDEKGTAITDLESGNVRFTISKLQGSDLGSMTGSWQSYVNVVSSPATGTGTEPRLQATYEREEDNFTNNGDGTYSYTFAQSLNITDEEVLGQAETEGLDLSYEPERTHRVSMQFDDNPNTTANPFYDWVPATGAAGNVFNMDIAATANCNNCHDPLGIHGGNRREMQYCVTCHNPGSTDPDSTNTVDLKVMIHKIHAGANLPSVQAGGQYVIYGFRGSEHDYSNLHYPQDIRNCVNCHAGSATGAGRDDLTLTAQGDNWAEYASGPACGSCHDGEGAQGHIAKHEAEEAECNSCHSEPGYAGSIANSHRNLIAEASDTFEAEILDVSSTMPGENPVVTFQIRNPQTGEPYDIKNDPVFAPFSVRIGVAWNTADYTNVGNNTGAADPTEQNASNSQSDAILASTDNGDGTYSVVMPLAIPDGSMPPGIAATGSGAATIEGHPAMDVDGDGEAENIPLTNVHAFFSIDEADGGAVFRRTSVELASCNSCHSTLSLHGNNRTDDLDGCVTCHNPRNTDKRVREIARDEPTDGKDEESIDFKTMVHAIHAPSMRENALEIVGFRGFSTHRYNEELVHYPGDLSNCTTCHTSDGYTLPLEDGVLGTTVDTGEDRADPSDDIVVTPITAVCSSCHDGPQKVLSHMEQNGGSFSTTQAAIDNDEVVETCETCHSSGGISDVSEVHNPH